MEPFRRHRGLVAPLNRVNVDTDQIIPKEYLKRVERTGFGQFLFADWRFDDDGRPEPGFVLNDPRYRDASILVAGANFGCGSSREHAPWALQDYGFRVIIAPSFADIFYNNCFKIGLLAVRLCPQQVDTLFQKVQKHDGYELLVELETCRVADDHGFEASFEVDAFRWECLLEGLDEIALTLQHEEKVRAFEEAHQPLTAE